MHFTQPHSPRHPRVLFRRFRDAGLDLLFPPACAVCRRDGSQLCDQCVSEFTLADGPRCSRCWSPDSASHRSATICDRCTADPPASATLRAAFVFQGALREAVHALKYDGITAVVGPLLDQIPPHALPPLTDLVTAVPMSGRRRRLRGYNQADQIARRLAERLAVPFDPHALQRHRSSAQQAKQPNREARRRNVDHAFRADPVRVRDRHLLVVDDVTTSGATLDACARALLEAGAARVDAWALARED